MSLHLFLANQTEDRDFVRQKKEKKEKKSALGHPIAQATSYCLLPDTL